MSSGCRDDARMVWVLVCIGGSRSNTSAGVLCKDVQAHGLHATAMADGDGRQEHLEQEGKGKMSRRTGGSPRGCGCRGCAARGRRRREVEEEDRGLGAPADGRR